VKRNHVPVLDGIRGLAIVAVLLHHIAYAFVPHGPFTRWFLPIPQFGAWGVDLFFVLSGFLITGILIDTKSAINRARSFYGRRILRIFPIYYLILGTVLVGEHFSQSIRAAGNLQGAADHLSYLLYFQNFLPLWHQGDFPLGVLSPFWSLAVEEQFYLLWPMLVWRLPPKAIVKVCAISMLVTLTLRMLLVPSFGPGIWVFALTPTRADGLFVGAALAAVLAIKGAFPKPLLAGIAIAGVLLLAAVPIFVPARELWETGSLMAVIGITGVALCSGALLVFCLTYRDSRLARTLQMRWLRNFGKYSYGLYVIHPTVYYAGEHILRARGIELPLPTPSAFVYAISLLVLTYCLAWLSFHCFESWFLDLKLYFAPDIQNEKPEEVYAAGAAVHTLGPDPSVHGGPPSLGVA
jgi:peptidoglycan/LPS O-acetylase OafA/YrhL